ncbi:MAG: dihydrofolate reductase family protein [Bacteroidetes bacterium]|nr:dihydrofolate reductase family protein [Bacteroidota bacterium]
MRKLIAAINMTIDGICDHTAGIADDELHIHYNDMLKNTGALLFGKTTYQLMENSWPEIVKNPTGNKPTDEFAVLIDNISKIVFSRTLKNVEWKNTELKNEIRKEDIIELKRQPGKDLFAGSPGLITEFMRLGLIDEYRLCVHPIIAGSGLRLFRDINERINLRLLKTKTFGSGATVLYYKPALPKNKKF